MRGRIEQDLYRSRRRNYQFFSRLLNLTHNPALFAYPVIGRCLTGLDEFQSLDTDPS